jgi:hypothetical protein
MRKLNQEIPPTPSRTLTWLLAICAISFLTSCSSTHIRGARTEAGLSVSPSHSVMVFALDDRPDMRAQFESDLVYFLQQRKVAAVGSSSRFAVSDFKPGAEEIRKQFATAGAESLLVVRTTGRTTFEKGPGYERAAGFGDIETDVQLAATLYRLSDGVTIWDGAMDTILKDQYHSGVVMRDVAKALVSRLAKDKVIP